MTNERTCHGYSGWLYASIGSTTGIKFNFVNFIIVFLYITLKKLLLRSETLVFIIIVYKMKRTTNKNSNDTRPLAPDVSTERITRPVREL